MNDMTDADFVEHMHDLHLKCVAPSFDDGNRLMTIARRCVDATEVTARLIAERDALTAEVTRLKAVEADYDLHEREMIDLEEDNGRLTAEVERLLSALHEAADELDAYYRAEYCGDHPYSKRKLAEAMRDNPARIAITQENTNAED